MRNGTSRSAVLVTLAVRKHEGNGRILLNGMAKHFSIAIIGDVPILQWRGWDLQQALKLRQDAPSFAGL